MRRCFLLLCWIVSSPALCLDHAESYLPRGGQVVDLFSGDLGTRVGRVRMEIRQDAGVYTLRAVDMPTTRPDRSVYTLRAADIPILHFLSEEQRFSVPGVAATEKAQTFDERGAIRLVYRGAHMQGTMEKHARIELVKFDEGRCQLSWKLSVSHQGRMIRDQQGSMAYDCQDPARVNSQSRTQPGGLVFPDL